MSPEVERAIHEEGVRQFRDRYAERREARRAASKTWVNCAGCGRSMRHDGLLCAHCQWTSRPSLDVPGRLHGGC